MYSKFLFNLNCYYFQQLVISCFFLVNHFKHNVYGVCNRYPKEGLKPQFIGVEYGPSFCKGGVFVWGN
jgi:hypothetical protein